MRKIKHAQSQFEEYVFSDILRRRTKSSVVGEKNFAVSEQTFLIVVLNNVRLSEL